MQGIELEIEKIVRYHNSKIALRLQKKEEEIEELISKTISSYKHKHYDFSTYKTLSINKSERKREVKQYDEWSVEQFLCIYLKRLLDKNFKVKYQNRNKQIHLLFDCISGVQSMSDFTIVRFDFENFFNSISSNYVFQKYIKNSTLEREQIDLFNDFVSGCPFCYAGINTSNAFSEIISREFDHEINKIFFDCGLILYKRYVDDGILIFNQFISQDSCNEKLNECINIVFKNLGYEAQGKCYTKLNTSSDKASYISKRNLKEIPCQESKFNYLGYSFVLKVNQKDKTQIGYGITESKRNKYLRKIEDIGNRYLVHNNLELLRHEIKAFSSRVVYRRKKYTYKVWKVKGFISNYNELRYHLNSLDDGTKAFLETAIENKFREIGIYDKCYFLKRKGEKSIYNLYNNLRKNKTLLFEENERVGINFETLKKLCSQVGINNFDDKNYNSLVREYLIAIKIGH